VKYIELFAGCGGLSLGLQSVGFSLQMANELSPMAAESYAFNFFGENLHELSQNNLTPTKTLWLASNFPPERLNRRLRENPYKFPSPEQAFSDLSSSGNNLDGALIVGSIIELNKWLENHKSATNRIKTCFGKGDVDLISGGPPCQSFSMAGIRQKDNEKNLLPWEFAKFVATIKPKFVLLENVSGILRPFKGENGTKYFAWFEVAKVFSKIGYIPLCLHVNAKFSDVPQNRPRFILIGIQEKIFDKLKSNLSDKEKFLIENSKNFFEKSKLNKAVDIDDLNCLDLTETKNFELVKSTFLESLINSKNLTTVYQAIDALKLHSRSSDSYGEKLNKIFSKLQKNSLPLKNHELRRNSELVRRRFKIYQIIANKDNEVKNDVLKVLKGRQSDVREHTWQELKNTSFLFNDGTLGRLKSKVDLLNFLAEHTTKKQIQKALNPYEPAPAALSIPDDACHYDPSHLRTLTVREMARIQSFPDRFIFRSKVTTGGTNRRHEVPQYTQVGNAVPPLLGRALGIAIKKLLSKLE
jgi:DNA (cytosine-5)-methyltransferase 1